MREEEKHDSSLWHAQLSLIIYSPLLSLQMNCLYMFASVIDPLLINYSLYDISRLIVVGNLCFSVYYTLLFFSS